MSFGVSVGDILAVVSLAWKLYLACSESSAEFKDLQADCLSVHIATKRVESSLSTGELLVDDEERTHLRNVLSGCLRTLSRLDSIVTRYRNLSTPRRAVWERIKFCTEDVADIRQKLILHLSALNAYTNSVQMSSLDRIERRLSVLALAIQSGDKPAGLMSDAATEDLNIWRELAAELEQEGIALAEIEQHREEIKVKIRTVLHDLDETSDIVWPEESISPQATRPVSMVDTACASATFRQSVADILFPYPERETLYDYHKQMHGLGLHSSNKSKVASQLSMKAWYDRHRQIYGLGLHSSNESEVASRLSMTPQTGHRGAGIEILLHSEGDAKPTTLAGARFIDVGCQTTISDAASVQEVPSTPPVLSPPSSSCSPAFSSQPSSPASSPSDFMKSIRVRMGEPCCKVLLTALKQYKIDDDWKSYSLYIVDGDQERCLGEDEQPVGLFKQMAAEGKTPSFILRKHPTSAIDFSRSQTADWTHAL